MQKGIILKKNMYNGNNINNNNQKHIRYHLLLLFITLFFLLQPTVLCVKQSLDEYLAEKEEIVKEFCNIVSNTYHSYDKLKFKNRIQFEIQNCPVRLTCPVDPLLAVQMEQVCRVGFGGESQCGCTGSGYFNNETSSIQFSDAENQQWFESVHSFQPNVTLRASNTKSKLLKFLCSSSDLNNAFMRNAREDEGLKWQYVASITGEFNMYPSTSNFYDIVQECRQQTGICRDYNPRTRPWFRAAITGAKKIVFLLDDSGTMQKENRFEKSKAFINTLANNLDYKDMIALVTTQRGRIHGCDQLRPATSDFIAVNFTECLNSIHMVPKYGKYHESLRASAEIFDDYRRVDSSSGGNNIIIFVTDGLDKTKIRSALINHLKFNRVRVFSFAINVMYSRTLDSLSCSTYGLSMIIQEKDTTKERDFTETITKFFAFFATLVGDAQEATWTEKYQDASAMGWMVTAAKACYTSSGELIAVAGVDVLLSQLNQFANESVYTNVILKRNKKAEQTVMYGSSSLVKGFRSRGISGCDYCRRDCSATTTGTILVALAVVITSCTILVTILLLWLGVNILNRYNAKWFHIAIDWIVSWFIHKQEGDEKSSKNET